MLWLGLAAGGVGFLLGFRLLRVHLVVAASGALVLVGAATARLEEWSPLMGIVAVFALLGVLQCGYFGGMMASSLRTRVRAPHAILRIRPR
jgi:hypothetical protein